MCVKILLEALQKIEVNKTLSVEYFQEKSSMVARSGLTGGGLISSLYKCSLLRTPNSCYVTYTQFLLRILDSCYVHSILFTLTIALCNSILQPVYNAGTSQLPAGLAKVQSYLTAFLADHPGQ